MYKKNKAFTLIETVLILFILSIGILSALSLARRSVQFQSVKKNLIIASYLSQEGLELMKNIRDTNIIMGRDYNAWNYISSPGVGEYYYGVDYYLDTYSFTDISQAVLHIDEDGFYRHIAAPIDEEETFFYRLITVNSEGPASSSIESWVQWNDKGNIYDYKLETVLYDVSQ